MEKETIPKITKHGNVAYEGWHVTSVRISPHFYNLAKIHRITWAEAMRVGISILLAEKGIVEYDNTLNVVRRMQKAVQQLELTTQELHGLKDNYTDKVHKAERRDEAEESQSSSSN